MTRVRFTLLLLLLAPLLTGCIGGMPHNSVATVGGDAEGERLDHAPQDERVRALTDEIKGLSPDVSPAEAAACAEHAITYSELLRDTYDITDPIEVNNIMVNLGLKQRGLCYELADDLNAELKDQHYKTLHFQRGTANWDDILREHNCVVVTAPGQTFYEGLVLDPWRNAGTLRWARVKYDHYPWIARHPEPPEANPPLATAAKASATQPAAARIAPSRSLASGKSAR